MLIVNADDFGRDTVATDRVVACFRNRRISSATAMVFMEDTTRAAELASMVGIPVGLHINFSEPFSDRSTPEPLRVAQRQVARFLKTSKFALVLYNPLLSKHFRYCFEYQLWEYIRLYNKTPSHFDGHQHLHLASNVLLSDILPMGSKVRKSFTFFAGEKSVVNRIYRRLIDTALRRRHVITDQFFSIAHFLDPMRLRQLIARSIHSDVELMTHPAIDREYEFLTGYEFASATEAISLASYNDLTSSS